MAYALKALGKEAVLVNKDVPPAHYFEFPGVADIVIADRVDPRSESSTRSSSWSAEISSERGWPGWNASS